MKEIISKDVPHRPWSRDELILALDLFLSNRASPPGKKSEEVARLSALLNQIAEQFGYERRAEFRNGNGVYMKMMNFRRFDPDFIAAGKVGLRRGNKDERIVWDLFVHDRVRLSEVAHAIRTASTLAITQPFNAGEIEECAEAEEGRVLTRLHRSRERRRILVEKRKRLALKKNGHLRCEACNFDFYEHYGERGRGQIEVHHRKPVCTLVEGETTRLEDLALVCANCHCIIHSASPWLTVEEVRDLILQRTE